MDKFQEVIARRVKLLIGVSVVSALLIFLIAIGSRELINISNEHTKDFISGFQVGIFVGMQLVILFQIRNLSTALKNKELLKALYIKEHDERSIMIQQKIGGAALNIVIIGTALASIAAGFFSELVFLTLLSTLVFIVSIKGVLKIYWNKKY